MEKIHKTNYSDCDTSNSTDFPDEQFIHSDGHSSPRNSNESDEIDALLHPNMHLTVLRKKKRFEDGTYIVGVLSILFGMGSWIGVTSTFLQVPLLVNRAPEKSSLPSYLVIIGQTANIGPIAYTVLQKYFPNRIKSSYMIWLVKVMAMITSIFAAYFHQKTIAVGGQEHSLALFICFFFLAIVGCTSSVLFMPYMGRFREVFLVNYLIGEGLGGFLPSIATLIQGVGGNSECILVNTTDGPKWEPYQPPPNFSTKDFYLFVFSIMLCSFMGFSLLDKLSICKKQYVPVTIIHGNNYIYNESKHRYEQELKDHQPLSRKHYIFLLFVMGTINFFGSGVFPSIQSFSCLPYGNVAYHLTVSLSTIASPCACFLALFLPHTSMRSLFIILSFGTILAIYQGITALMSPHPPLVTSNWGRILVVACWVLFMGLMSFSKLTITSVMRFQGGKSLVWTGAVSQAGSAIGSVLTFLLVNFTNIFVPYDPCQK